MGVLRQETPTEYFRDLVDSALARQRIQASELTAFYLVNLLAGFVRLDRAGVPDVEPLAVQFVRSLETGGTRRRVILRSLGDVSLFVSGFFADSLARRVVDVDYYVAMGEYAYGRLSQTGGDPFAEVFAELAADFLRFVDVLGDVSERGGLSSDADLLRLYEKWLRTRSVRDGHRLAARGIAPNASMGERFIQ